MLREYVDLQPYNTLNLHARARFFCEPSGQEELQKALAFAREKQLPVLPLGEGSNMVITRDYPGLVLRLVDHSIHVEKEDDSSVHVRVGAGMVWHTLVEKSLENGWFGLENLALIPGTVGAAPVQNIGAYGVEMARFVVSVSAVMIDTDEVLVLDKAACEFAYRNSVFKQALREKTVITSVVLCLSKLPEVRADYAALRDYLAAHTVQEPSPLQVFNAVCEVRRSRLPDPHVLPNAGSFFKNPQISAEQFSTLQSQYPEIVSYPGENRCVKLAAAWLIDQLGWKGRCMGDACVHDKQALVLVNRGAASGEEVLTLANTIMADVQQRFGVTLEYEPWVW